MGAARILAQAVKLPPKECRDAKDKKTDEVIVEGKCLSPAVVEDCYTYEDSQYKPKPNKAPMKKADKWICFDSTPSPVSLDPAADPLSKSGVGVKKVTGGPCKLGEVTCTDPSTKKKECVSVGEAKIRKTKNQCSELSDTAPPAVSPPPASSAAPATAKPAPAPLAPPVPPPPPVAPRPEAPAGSTTSDVPEKSEGYRVTSRITAAYSHSFFNSWSGYSGKNSTRGVIVRYLTPVKDGSSFVVGLGLDIRGGTVQDGTASFSGLRQEYNGYFGWDFLSGPRGSATLYGLVGYHHQSINCADETPASQASAPTGGRTGTRIINPNTGLTGCKLGKVNAGGTGGANGLHAGMGLDFLWTPFNIPFSILLGAQAWIGSSNTVIESTSRDVPAGFSTGDFSVAAHVGVTSHLKSKGRWPSPESPPSVSIDKHDSGDRHYEDVSVSKTVVSEGDENTTFEASTPVRDKSVIGEMKEIVVIDPDGKKLDRGTDFDLLDEKGSILKTPKIDKHPETPYKIRLNGTPKVGIYKLLYKVEGEDMDEREAVLEARVIMRVTEMVLNPTTPVTATINSPAWEGGIQSFQLTLKEIPESLKGMKPTNGILQKVSKDPKDVQSVKVAFSIQALPSDKKEVSLAVTPVKGESLKEGQYELNFDIEDPKTGKVIGINDPNPSALLTLTVNPPPAKLSEIKLINPNRPGGFWGDSIEAHLKTDKETKLEIKIVDEVGRSWEGSVQIPQSDKSQKVTLVSKGMPRTLPIGGKCTIYLRTGGSEDWTEIPPKIEIKGNPQP